MKTYKLFEVFIPRITRLPITRHLLWLSHERIDDHWTEISADFQDFRGYILIDLLGCNGFSNRFFTIYIKDGKWDFNSLEKEFFSILPEHLQVCNKNAKKEISTLISCSILTKKDIKQLFKDSL